MDLLIENLGKILTSIFITVAFALLLRSVKGKTKTENNINWLSYGAGLKLLAIVSLAIAGGLLALPLLLEVPHGDKKILYAMVVAFGIAGAVLGVETFVSRIGYDSSQIYVQSAWRGNRVVPWSDIVTFSVPGSSGGCVIHSNYHGKIEVNRFMSGLPELVAVLDGNGVIRI